MRNSRDKIRRAEVRSLLETPEIIAILGARQVGKTTLMRHIFETLPGPKVFLDFEDPEVLSLFDEDIRSFARLYVEGKDFVFLDEFQYSREGGKHLKYLYDHYAAKFVISGSSSLDLAVRAASMLVGRIFLLELFPLNFAEFLSFTDPDLLPLVRDHVREQNPLSPSLHRRLLRYIEAFTRWGGYPRVVLARTPEEKEEVLKNLLITYLMKDIRGFFRLASEYPLQKLMRALALQVSGLIQYNELSQVSGLTYHELKRHLAILEETYIVRLSRPFFTNRRLELVKNPKVYFVDPGFRNHLIRDFRGWDSRPDTGKLVENFVASELIKQGHPLRFWRTKSGAEVDFVAETSEGPIPLEVKAGQTRTIGKSLRSFIKKYRPSVAYFLYTGNIATETVEGVRVQLLPLYALPFLAL